MHVVPVIDIRNGEVVRAIAGRRAEYAPIATPLATSSAPLDVVRGLLTLQCFPVLYIADLDAIERRGANRAAIDAIGDAFPNLRLWVDAGARDRADLERWLSLRNVEVVIGSESFETPDALRRMRDNARVILSLDFKGERFLGEPGLLRNTELWPRRVIVMTLSRVGAEVGPDVPRLADIVSRANGRRIYAAGGARGLDDLRRLRKAGAAGALVATALHDGRLSPRDLVELRGAGHDAQKEREPRGLPL